MEMKNKEKVIELINQIGNALDSPAYAAHVLTECGKEILKIAENYDKLIDYVADAERHHIEMAGRGHTENGIKSQAVQDITLFMEHELEIPF